MGSAIPRLGAVLRAGLGNFVKIYLGVIDLPYTDDIDKRVRKVSSAARKKGRRVADALETLSTGGAKSSGDVAVILEKKYHIIELFYETRQSKIAEQLANSIADKIQDIINGAPLSGSPIDAGASAIEDWFKQFLATQEVEHLGIPGVPTQAALDGVNHRLKKKRGRRRPSFIDTGLYMASFKVWQG